MPQLPLSPDISPLFEIMARLRDPERGCPWDVKQDFASIAPYTIEEAYEVADAIEREDMASLKDELGDLLLQVVFHSRMAEEQGEFDLADVIDAICDKMVRRHPHIFGGEIATSDEAVKQNWEDIKAEERVAKQGEEGALSGVALALPALLRAQKLQKRAARVGFDWPDSSGARGKIFEELDELESATSLEERHEEIGDLLFAVVNYGRHLGVEAEYALKAANQKFERRFSAMEALGGEGFDKMSLAQKENLWLEIKQVEADI